MSPRTLSLGLSLLLLLGALWSVAEAADGDGDGPALLPSPFRHATHKNAFAESSLTCVDCHAVGLRSTGAGAAVPTLPEAPWSSCHGCHRGELRRAPAKAPSTCLSCHSSLAALKPADHAVDWTQQHGEAARSFQADCSSCHDKVTCVSCHEERGALSRNPHPPGFAAFHGVQAQLDPRSCTTCHIPSTCTSCHQSGAAPW